jgi:hypothetical protein
MANSRDLRQQSEMRCWGRAEAAAREGEPHTPNAADELASLVVSDGDVSVDHYCSSANAIGGCCGGDGAHVRATKIASDGGATAMEKNVRESQS